MNTNIVLTPMSLQGNKAESLTNILINGGCYWKRERADSPGHSIAIPSGTPFKIALEGSASSLFVSGTCREGCFEMETGTYAGTKFRSASEAVKTVRGISTNAFLYVHLFIDGGWTLANEFRRSDHSQLDAIEEVALEHARTRVRNSPNGRFMTEADVYKKAAQLVSENPKFVDFARKFIAIMQD
jgi:hypothetical protein